MITLRGVRPAEAERLRELRLRALADAPAAFGAAAEDEADLGDEHWEQLATVDGDEGVVFVAVDGEDWIGMAAGRWFARERGIAQLWGMWVEPARRGEGIGARLVDAVRGWAREHQARFVRLGAVEGSPAIGLYGRLGFVDTGERRPLRRDAAVIAVFMARPA